LPYRITFVLSVVSSVEAFVPSSAICVLSSFPSEGSDQNESNHGVSGVSVLPLSS